ncbi:hypothetical protein GIS00_01950 [Nakamurella sp. YIM 132087]|uniref:Uncharacterized protein n=1 Tax=Nakamurella alba TaxID=2665158 RepID=A0A7K1FGW6_9ACTN|nr:hypothetical protein [Nakamurella alba]MTD12709.1 hypothetical protein [Nakamurella alba]
MNPTDSRTTTRTRPTGRPGRTADRRGTTRSVRALAGLATGAALLLAGACGSQGTPVRADGTTPALTTPAASATTTAPVSSSVVDGPAGTYPTGTVIEYTWNTGSIAPPYNHEWTVTLTVGEDGSPDTGTLMFQAMYVEDEPSWEQTFEPGPEAVAAYLAVVHEQFPDGTIDDADDGSVGGSWATYRITLPDGTVFGDRLGFNRDSRIAMEALEEASKALVPAKVWNEVEGQYLDWQAEQDQ